MEELHEGDL